MKQLLTVFLALILVGSITASTGILAQNINTNQKLPLLEAQAQFENGTIPDNATETTPPEEQADADALQIMLIPQIQRGHDQHLKIFAVDAQGNDVNAQGDIKVQIINERGNLVGPKTINVQSGEDVSYKVGSNTRPQNITVTATLLSEGLDAAQNYWVFAKPAQVPEEPIPETPGNETIPEEGGNETTEPTPIPTPLPNGTLPNGTLPNGTIPEPIPTPLPNGTLPNGTIPEPEPTPLPNGTLPNGTIPEPEPTPLPNGTLPNGTIPEPTPGGNETGGNETAPPEEIPTPLPNGTIPEEPPICIPDENGTSCPTPLPPGGNETGGNQTGGNETTEPEPLPPTGGNETGTAGNVTASIENLQNSTAILEQTLESAGEDINATQLQTVKEALGEQFESFGAVGGGVVNATLEQLGTLEEGSSLTTVTLNTIIDTQTATEEEPEPEEDNGNGDEGEE